MDCKLAARLISSRIDGELETGKAPALEAHLESCPACKALEETERSLRAAIRAATPAVESRPPALSPVQILFRSRRAFAEEASLVRLLQRVAALAAILLFSSGLAVFSALGPPEGTSLAVFSPLGPPEGTSLEASIRVVASSEAPLEDLIDQENSIVIGFGPPAFTDGDWAPEE